MHSIGCDPGAVAGAIVRLDDDGRPTSALWWRTRSKTRGADLLYGRGEWLVTLWRASSLAYPQIEDTARVVGFGEVLQRAQAEFLGAGAYVLTIEGLYLGGGKGGNLLSLVESAGWLHAALRPQALGDTHRPKPSEWRKVVWGSAPRGTDAAKRKAIASVAELGLTGKTWEQSHVCEAYAMAVFGRLVGPVVQSGDEWDDLAECWTHE